MTTPDLHMLAEEAAHEFWWSDDAGFVDAIAAIERALAKLQQQHESERTAAVAETLERAAQICRSVQEGAVDRTPNIYSLQYSTGYASACEDCEAAIRSPKPRSDMVCVPREPTEKMTAAALKAWDDRNYYATRGYVNEGDASLCYEAMLAAAQEKP